MGLSTGQWVGGWAALAVAGIILVGLLVVAVVQLYRIAKPAILSTLDKLPKQPEPRRIEYEDDLDPEDPEGMERTVPSGKSTESLPWYRKKGFKGDLTENEKRQLDSFRMRENHPAASYDSLPEEVQYYISKLEIEGYDCKQQSLAASCLFVSGVGAFFLIRYYFGYEAG
jgi:hypothetical protein